MNIEKMELGEMSMKYLDYTYYRLMLYFQNQRDEIYEFTACIFISALELPMILSLLTIFEIIFNFRFPGINALFVLFFIMMVFALNYFRYIKKRRVDYLAHLWEEENSKIKKRRKVILWFFTVLIFFLFGLLLALRNLFSQS